MSSFEIIDNAYSASDREEMFTFVRNSLFKLGWQDQHWDDVVGQRRLMFSHYGPEDVEAFGVFSRHNTYQWN